MYVNKVGELFIPGKYQYGEGTFFEYAESGPFLIYAFRRPSESEIKAAKKGKVELALYEDPPLIFVLHKVEGLADWSDSPFSIRMYDGMGKVFNWSEPIAEGQGLGLTIALVDAGTGVLRALRYVGTSTEFAKKLRAAILRQYEMPFSVEAYNRKIDEVYSRYSTEQLLKRATARHQI